MISSFLSATVSVFSLKLIKRYLLRAKCYHMSHLPTPDTNLNLFNDNMERMLIQLRDEDKCCYMMGDYNINLLNRIYRYITCQFFHGIINRPTRFRHESATLIDNIFTNNYASADKTSQCFIYTDITIIFQLFTLIAHLNTTGVKQCTFQWLISNGIAQKEMVFHSLFNHHFIMITCISY